MAEVAWLALLVIVHRVEELDSRPGFHERINLLKGDEFQCPKGGDEGCMTN